jgi:type I restriction enzyme, R subunit
MKEERLSEQDVTSKFVLPALQRAGWDSLSQIREQYTFTAGRIVVRGKTVKRGEQKRIDVLLFHKNHYPIAIIEVKGHSHALGDGMQQGLRYAEDLDVPFVYSTNGAGFLEHDRLVKEGERLAGTHRRKSWHRLRTSVCVYTAQNP